MKNIEIQYNNYYVAFIDFLGFKSITEDVKWDCRSIYRLLSMASSSDTRKITLDESLKDTYKKIETYIMSDSIVFYIRKDFPFALLCLLCKCSLLLEKLSLNDKPVPIRGAITEGKFIRRGDIIFGPALTDAYKLESEFAVYPRIIVSTRLVNNVIARDIKEFQNYIKFYRRYIIDEKDNWASIKNNLYSSNDSYNIEKYYAYVCSQIYISKDKKTRDKYLYLKTQMETELKGTKVGNKFKKYMEIKKD